MKYGCRAGWACRTDHWWSLSSGKIKQSRVLLESMDLPVIFFGIQLLLRLSFVYFVALIITKTRSKKQFFAWISINLRTVEVQATLEDRANDALSDQFQSLQMIPSMSQKTATFHFWVCGFEGEGRAFFSNKAWSWVTKCTSR